MKASLLAIALLQLSAIACHPQAPGSSYANRANPDPAPFRAIHLPVATHPTMVTVAAIWFSDKIDNNERAFYACLLFISA